MENQKQDTQIPFSIKAVVYIWSVNALYLLIKSIATKEFGLLSIIYILILFGGSGVIKMRLWGLFTYIILFLILIFASFYALSFSLVDSTFSLVLNIVLTVIAIIILISNYKKFK